MTEVYNITNIAENMFSKGLDSAFHNPLKLLHLKQTKNLLYVVCVVHSQNII